MYKKATEGDNEGFIDHTVWFNLKKREEIVPKVLQGKQYQNYTDQSTL